MSIGSVEPGIFLTIAFGLGVYALRAYMARRFNEGKEPDETRVQLRLDQISAIMAQADGYLSDQMPYYQALSPNGRTKFLSRLRMVLATKKFYGKQGLVLTSEIETLAAASLVQVTFGLNSFLLERFDRIIIYPNVFYNKLMDRHLKGSTSPAGIIRFSWKHLQHGFELSDDNINLGLHEVAHALKIMIDEENNHDDSHLDRELADFLDSGSEVRDAILEGKMSVIRKYASTNEHEFFACCVEYFFETPEGFKQNLPQLYHRLVRLLRQDPANSGFDYMVTEMPTVAKRERYGRFLTEVKRKYSDHDHLSWVPKVLGVGMVLGTPISVIMHFTLESAASVILLLHVSIFILGLLIFRRKLFLSGYTNEVSFALFMIFGWGTSASATVLVLNAVVPVYRYSVTDEVKIKYERASWYYVNPNSSLRNVRSGVSSEARREVDVHRVKGHRIMLESNVYYGMFGLKVYGGYDVRLEAK